MLVIKHRSVIGIIITVPQKCLRLQSGTLVGQVQKTQDNMANTKRDPENWREIVPSQTDKKKTEKLEKLETVEGEQVENIIQVSEFEETKRQGDQGENFVIVSDKTIDKSRKEFSNNESSVDKNREFKNSKESFIKNSYKLNDRPSSESSEDQKKEFCKENSISTDGALTDSGVSSIGSEPIINKSSVNTKPRVEIDSKDKVDKPIESNHEITGYLYKAYRELDNVKDSLFIKLLSYLEELVKEGLFANQIPNHPLELKERLSKEIRANCRKYNYVFGESISPSNYMEAFSWLYSMRIVVDNFQYNRLYDINMKKIDQENSLTVHLLVSYAYSVGNLLRVKRCDGDKCYREACWRLQE